MTFDRAQIMQAAWTIARRFAGNRETWGQRLSRALKSVWWDVKDAARSAARLAAAVAERAAHFAGRSAASIRAEVENMENTDRLGFDGIQRLSDARRALAEAEAREADAAAEDFAAKRALIAAAQGRFYVVSFIRADGTRRVMRVQPAALKFHVKGEAASEASRKAAETRAQRHSHLQPVWDADAKAPRSVNLATILSIKVDGATHTFNAAS
ncbi:hypothetical protein [Tabrizicola sp.]|uniref:hypothetical protein n=1 Tax=Tabrizicola sp. TaxID=2005166 RepID=UPI001A3B22C9|nr:hypothetical protein [Tabrizicola sp.]MBL9062753.1 hypothetical protein [Tabrizicola sp.]